MFVCALMQFDFVHMKCNHMNIIMKSIPQVCSSQNGWMQRIYIANKVILGFASIDQGSIRISDMLSINYIIQQQKKVGIVCLFFELAAKESA